MNHARYATVALVLAGCSPHHTVEEPRVPVELPETYSQTAGDEIVAEEDEVPDEWWLAFGDPELSHLVDEALQRNFQLGAAWAALDPSGAVPEPMTTQDMPLHTASTSSPPWNRMAPVSVHSASRSKVATATWVLTAA